MPNQKGVHVVRRSGFFFLMKVNMALVLMKHIPNYFTGKREKKPTLNTNTITRQDLGI